MITVKVTFDNGNTVITGINATEEEARAYYVGQWFNLGRESDDMRRGVSLEVLEEMPANV